MKITSGLRMPRRSWPPYIWRRSRWKYCAGVVQLAHLHVVFGAERQVAFDARAGMFRALAFVAVRQQHHQAARLAPFRFGAGDELIDHDLRAVGEVAELRFPEDQRQRVGHAVAEFETEHAYSLSELSKTSKRPCSGEMGCMGM